MSFLTERDKDEIAEAAKWAADEGCREVFIVVERIVAQHVGATVSRVVGTRDTSPASPKGASDD